MLICYWTSKFTSKVRLFTELELSDSLPWLHFHIPFLKCQSHGKFCSNWAIPMETSSSSASTLPLPWLQAPLPTVLLLCFHVHFHQLWGLLSGPLPTKPFPRFLTCQDKHKTLAMAKIEQKASFRLTQPPSLPPALWLPWISGSCSWVSLQHFPVLFPLVLHSSSPG